MTLLAKNFLNQLNLDNNKTVVVVPEDFCLFEHLSVEKNVALFLARQVEKLTAEKKAVEALCKAGLGQLCESFPKLLSALDKEKLVILRGLVQTPDMLLIEEPFKQLNAKQGEDMVKFINSLAENSSSIGVVTSNPSYANQLSPQVMSFCGAAN